MKIIQIQDQFLVEAKLKYLFLGVYPESILENAEWHLLPWAEPAMSMFGGGWTNQRNRRFKY